MKNFCPAHVLTATTYLGQVFMIFFLLLGEPFILGAACSTHPDA